MQQQSIYCSDVDMTKLCSFDLEVIDAPTAPLIHRAARLLLINAGQGTLMIQKTAFELKAGSLVSILPWQISEMVEVKTPLQYYIIVYNFDMVSDIIKSCYKVSSETTDIVHAMTRRPVVQCSLEQLEQIRSLFLSLRDEVGIQSTLEQIPPKAFSGIFIINRLVELIVHLIRIGENGGSGYGAKKDEHDKREILQYIYLHLNEKLTLKMLSRKFYMSETSISSYITHVTGLSFFDLLNEMRVGKTISYLLYTDLTLEELAEIMGYVDASHISKVFAARVGMKANEYRKTYQRMNEICKVRESRKAYDIVSFIYRNYSDNLSAKGTAERFGINVGELHRILMYQTEKNFEDFLNFIRVNRACELLTESGMSIIDISAEVGYNNTKTFTRNFLKYRLMTPSEFRKTVVVGSL